MRSRPSTARSRRSSSPSSASTTSPCPTTSPATCVTRVLLLPQTGTKGENDVVMRFVREEEMTDEERGARDVVQTIVRNKQVPVQNKGTLKPKAVAERVSKELGLVFTLTGDHVRVWRHF